MIQSLTIAQAKFTDVDSGTVVDVVVVICAILGAVFLVISLVEKFKAKKSSGVTLDPSPLHVAEVEKLATRDEVRAMGARLEGDIDGLRVAMKEERAANNREGANMHRRIDEIVETLAETKGLLSGVKENTDRLLARSMK